MFLFFSGNCIVRVMFFLGGRGNESGVLIRSTVLGANTCSILGVCCFLFRFNFYGRVVGQCSSGLESTVVRRVS